MTSFRFIDLFAGIGGFRMGFDAVGGSCVFTSEINKNAQKCYAANFSESEIAGDITKINARDIPEHDLLIGGFPCQSFSMAGSRKGLEDARGTLFFDICRILEHHKTPMFVLENVKGLVSHDNGNTYKVIMKTLTDLGYRISVRVLNAACWLPQNRKRIFIAGTLKPEPFDLDFLLEPNNNLCLGDILEPEPSPSLTLSDNTWRWIKNYSKRQKELNNGFGYEIAKVNKKSPTLIARYGIDPGSIMIAQVNDKPRQLSVLECKRLMGFPEGFVMPISDRQAYKCLGNAVCPPVSQAIAEHLMERKERK